MQSGRNLDAEEKSAVAVNVAPDGAAAVPPSSAAQSTHGSQQSSKRLSTTGGPISVTHEAPAAGENEEEVVEVEIPKCLLAAPDVLPRGPRVPLTRRETAEARQAKDRAANDDHEDNDDDEDETGFVDDVRNDFDAMPMRRVGIVGLSGGDGAPLGTVAAAVKRTGAAVTTFALKHSVSITVLLLIVLITAAVVVTTRKSDKSELRIDEETAAPAQTAQQPVGPEGDEAAAEELIDALARPAFNVLKRVIPSHARFFRLHIVKKEDIAADATGPAVKRKIFSPSHGAFEDEHVAKKHKRYAALTDVFTAETITVGSGGSAVAGDVSVLVVVNGTSNVALAAGAYWYLKYVAGCQVTWGTDGSGHQITTLPAPGEPMPLLTAEHVRTGIPRVPRDAEEVSREEKALEDVGCTLVDEHPAVAVFRATAPVRYSWNMCTFSYTAVWWDAKRWRQEIDWLALHGINLPLAIGAQEYVWVQVFAEYNITLDDLQEWLTGPAFLAWQRAGNIRGFAGPLPLHFLEAQRDLQAYILREMRALDMRPILPCFGGHIPAALFERFPNASVSRSESWNNFPESLSRVYFLDPTDPLYVEIGRRYIEVQTALFGTDHFFNCDSFNEVDPSSADPEYLAQAASAVHRSITAVDPEAVWIMQGWLFHFGFWTPERVQAYIAGIPNHDDLLILDLNSEEGVLARKFQDFHGKPWVWNLLHNYGGVRGMYGSLGDLARGPFSDMRTQAWERDQQGNQPRTGMVGIGFTPEAIEQNPVMYELLTDTMWYPHRSGLLRLACQSTTTGGGENPEEGASEENDAPPFREGDRDDDDDDDDEDDSSDNDEGFTGDRRDHHILNWHDDDAVRPDQLLRSLLNARAPQPIDAPAWLSHYIHQRYGVPLCFNERDAAHRPSGDSGGVMRYNATLRWAWDALVAAVYNQHGHPRSEMEHHPRHPSSDYGWSNGFPAMMVEAARRYVGTMDELGASLDRCEFDNCALLLELVTHPEERSKLLRAEVAGRRSVRDVAMRRAMRTLRLGTVDYDMVDIVRQAATMVFTAAHQLFNDEASLFLRGEYTVNKSTGAYITLHNTPRQRAALRGTRALAQLLRDIFLALDDMFDTNVNFQMSTQWLVPAIRCANISDHAEVARFIFNAKNQITQWGPNGQISDYAAKAWSGLYREYYKGRFDIVLDNVLHRAGNVSEGLPDTWESTEEAVLQFEHDWNHDARVAPLLLNEMKAELSQLGQRLERLVARRGTPFHWRRGGAPDEHHNLTAPTSAAHQAMLHDGDATAAWEQLRPELEQGTHGAAKRVLQLISASPQQLAERFALLSPDEMFRSSWSNFGSLSRVRMTDAMALAALCDLTAACVGFSTEGVLFLGDAQSFEEKPSYMSASIATYLHRTRCAASVSGCRDRISAASAPPPPPPPPTAQDTTAAVPPAHGGGVPNQIPVNGKEWSTSAP